MRFKYLILLISLSIFGVENAFSEELTLKDIFSVINPDNIIKPFTKTKIIEQLNKQENLKDILIQSIIPKAVEGFRRSTVLSIYGTQFKRETLKDFIEILHAITEKIEKDTSIDLTLNPGSNIDGSQAAGKQIKISFAELLALLDMYIENEPPSTLLKQYCQKNIAETYDDIKRKELAEKAATLVDEQKKKDDEAKEEARVKEEERVKKEKSDATTSIQALLKTKAEAKAKAEAKSAITEMQAILKGAAEAKKKAEEQKKKDDEAKEEARIKEEERKAKEDAEAKKKADEEATALDEEQQKDATTKMQALLKTKAEAKAKAEEKSAITEMQAILKGTVEAKKKAEEQKKKDDEAKEEARIKEEERKAKEDTEAKKKADEEAEETKKDDETTDTQLDQEPEAKAKEEGSPEKLKHITKERARTKHRPPTISKKQTISAPILDEIVQKINSISIEISIPGLARVKPTKTSKKIYDLTEHEIIKNQDPISAIKTEISKLVEDLKKLSSTELESMLNKNTSSKQDLDKAFRIIYPEEYKEDGTLKIFFKLMQESVKTEIQKTQDRITNQLKTELDEIAKTTEIEAQIYILERILSSRDYDNNFLQTKVENKIFENLKKLFDEYATKITSLNLDVGTKLNNLLKNAKDKAFLTPDQKAACVEMYAKMLLETSLINPPSEKEKTEVIKIKNIVSKPDFNKKYLQNYPSITNSIYTHIKEVFKSQIDPTTLTSILTMAKTKYFLTTDQQNFIKILDQIQKIISSIDIQSLIGAAMELNQLVKYELKEELTNNLPSGKDLNWIQTTLSNQIKGTNSFQNAAQYANLRSFLSVQDIKEQPAEEKTKEAEAAAEELKIKQAHAKSLAEEKAIIEKEWNELSQTSSTIESLSTALKDEKFNREYLKDTPASKLIFESIKKFCLGLDTENKNVTELKKLLAIAIAKYCFDEATSTALKELEKVVSIWINYLKTIYDTGNTDISYGNPSQTAKIWYAPPINVVKLGQYNAVLTTKNINLSAQLTALNKPENIELIKTLVSKNFITLDTLAKIRQTLINVCGNEYNKQTYEKLKETIEKFLPTIPPDTAQKSTRDAKTGAKRHPEPTPKVVPPHPTKARSSSESTSLKQKLGLLKQNLAKLKTKLSQLSQKLGQLKTALPKK